MSLKNVDRFFRVTAALFSLMLLSATTSSNADDQAPTTAPTASAGVISASDKAALDASKDQDVIIEGVCTEAAWSNSGKVMNLRFEGSDESKFGAVVFLKNKEKMNEAFNGDATKAWSGSKLRIKGKLVEYGGKADSMKGSLQVVITEPSQVTVVELPATQPAQ